LAIPTVAIMLPSLLLLPVDQTINLGQVNLLLLSLVIIDLSLPDKSRFKGVLIGISAGIKLVPGLFVIYYLMRRQFRAAITLCATALGTVLLSFIIFSKASYEYWTHYIFETTHVARVAAALDNESLRGMLARILHSETAAIIPWFVFSAVMLCIVLVVTWYATKYGEDYMGITAIALTGLLMAPVSWHHTWVWIVPITIYTANAAYRTRSKFLWGCAIIPLVIIALRMDKWFIPDPYQTRPLYGIQLVMSNIVTFASILLVICFLLYLVFYKKQQKVLSR
jgi:alpha-1,2-mannosyltransferase